MVLEGCGVIGGMGPGHCRFSCAAWVGTNAARDDADTLHVLVDNTRKFRPRIAT